MGVSRADILTMAGLILIAYGMYALEPWAAAVSVGGILFVLGILAARNEDK